MRWIVIVGLAGPHLDGTDLTQFAITATDTCTAQTLAPGTSCILPITFLPTTAGMKSAIIGVTQPAGLPLQFTVSGNATP